MLTRDAMIEISQDLGFDETRIETWNHILTNLSDFPVKKALK